MRKAVFEKLSVLDGKMEEGVYIVRGNPPPVVVICRALTALAYIKDGPVKWRQAIITTHMNWL